MDLPAREGNRRGTSARLLMHTLAAGLSGEGDAATARPPLPWGSASFGAERQKHDEGNGIAAH